MFLCFASSNLNGFYKVNKTIINNTFHYLNKVRLKNLKLSAVIDYKHRFSFFITIVIILFLYYQLCFVQFFNKILLTKYTLFLCKTV